MAAHIQFLNFGWKDMTAPSFDIVVDIVKVVASIFEADPSNKIVVHCHAGYGNMRVVYAIFLCKWQSE